MESAACPFCCESKFSNQLLLKYHLLSLTTNVFCPFCGKRLDDINMLIIHLDKRCIDEELNPENEIGENENLMIAEDSQNDDRQTDNDVELDLKKTENLNEPQSETTFYHCCECNIDFLSIQDHINYCHTGQKVLFQVSENEDINKSLQILAGIVDEQNIQSGSWIKWGDGYFYTNHKDLIMEHLNENQLLVNVICSDRTKDLKLQSEDMIQENEEEIDNIDSVNSMLQIDTDFFSTNMYLNHCYTDDNGDKFFDIPIYLLYQASEKVNFYFKLKECLVNNKKVRLIGLNSINQSFYIEQILFKNKPTNFNIIPVIEKLTEYVKCTGLENLDECLVLLWTCVVCNVKSNHWVKLNNHNC